MPARPKLYLRSYPIPEGLQAHAGSWDGLLISDTQNLSMDVFGSLYLTASATSRLGPSRCRRSAARFAVNRLVRGTNLMRG